MKNRPLKVKTESDRSRYRMSGRTMWAVLFVWAILFVMIRATFKFEGNPIVLFLIMLALFFVVLFCVRVGLLRTRLWWYRTRPGLVRLLASFLPNRRR